MRVRERGGLLAALPGREGMSDGVALPLTERERGAGPEGRPILALGRLGKAIARCVGQQKEGIVQCTGRLAK